MAASMGMPFLPTPRCSGSDLLERTPAQHIRCPFTDELLSPSRRSSPTSR